MLRRTVAAALCIVLGLSLISGWVGPSLQAQAQKDTLVIYTYSSFVSDGAADLIAKVFKGQTGADVQFVATDDSRTMLAKLIANRDASGQTPADAFIGVEVNDLGTANDHDVFAPLTAADIPNLANIPKEIQFDPDGKLIPYEHGFITLIYDSQKLGANQIPQTFAQLLDPKFRKQFILEDPRTSSPGLSFLLWTIAQFGDPGYLDYWKQLMPNILTITQSWDAAFDLFSKGEAPLMVSFSTDHAYDLIVNQSNRIQVLLLGDEGYRTIFGMGLVKGAKHPDLGKQFLNLVLSPEVQSQLPETEWMIPANMNATARVLWWQNLVVPSKPVLLPAEQVSPKLKRWVDQWMKTALGG
jgi:thiamine transport system substrate-binding protein